MPVADDVRSFGTKSLRVTVGAPLGALFSVRLSASESVTPAIKEQVKLRKTKKGARHGGDHRHS